MGLEWWKYWFCSFFRDMEMVCTWSHKSRLSRILHFLQRCCLPRMLYFLFSILENKNVYIQWFWCLHWILHYIVVHITICTYMYNIYIYIYTLVDKFIAFSQSFMFFENYVFDIEQTWVQFPATNSAFSEKCSASFHAVHECFSQKNMSRLNMHLFKRWFNYDWI